MLVSSYISIHYTGIRYIVMLFLYYEVHYLDFFEFKRCAIPTEMDIHISVKILFRLPGNCFAFFYIWSLFFQKHNGPHQTGSCGGPIPLSSPVSIVTTVRSVIGCYNNHQRSPHTVFIFLLKFSLVLAGSYEFWFSECIRKRWGSPWFGHHIHSPLIELNQGWIEYFRIKW